MRHSKRDYLTQGDIRLALKKLNFGDSSSMLLGYPSHVPFQYIKMGQAQGHGAATQNYQQSNLGAPQKVNGGMQDLDGDQRQRSMGAFKAQSDAGGGGPGQGTFFALGANNEPIYDHGVQQSSEQAVWFQKSEHIDLKDYIFNNSKAQGSKYSGRSGPKGSLGQPDVYQSQKDQQVPLKMTYEMHFVTINGVQPNIPQNVEENLNLAGHPPEKQDPSKHQPDKTEVTGKNIIQAVK